MRKDKTGNRFGYRCANFTPRQYTKFSIGPNSNPRKVSRWLGRGGGVPVHRSPAESVASHIHPRHRRAFVAAQAKGS